MAFWVESGAQAAALFIGLVLGYILGYGDGIYAAIRKRTR